jgi:hypothetical protein
MAREVLDPFQVTTGHRVAFPGLTQPLCCILTDRFEETKTNTRTTGNTRQERTFDEPFEEIDDPSARDLGVGDDVFSGVRGKACGEDPQASEDDPFVHVEKVVATVERRSQGALALGRGARAMRKDSELIVEPIGELAQ